MPLGDGFQRLLLQAVQAVRGRRKLLQAAGERLAQVGKRGGLCARQRRQSGRFGRGPGFPRPPRQRDLLGRDRLARGEEGGELLRVQFAQATEAREAGKVANADEAEPRLIEREAREPVEQADENRLVEEAGIKPQDHFVVLGRACQGIVFRLEPPGHVRSGEPGGGDREIPGAKPVPRLSREPRRRRTLDDRITPDGYLARHAALAQRSRRGIPAMDVKH